MTHVAEDGVASGGVIVVGHGRLRLSRACCVARRFLSEEL
jgi:hypothetical protein